MFFTHTPAGVSFRIQPDRRARCSTLCARLRLKLLSHHSVARWVAKTIIQFFFFFQFFFFPSRLQRCAVRASFPFLFHFFSLISLQSDRWDKANFFFLGYGTVDHNLQQKNGKWRANGERKQDGSSLSHVTGAPEPPLLSLFSTRTLPTAVNLLSQRLERFVSWTHSSTSPPVVVTRQRASALSNHTDTQKKN